MTNVDLPYLWPVKIKRRGKVYTYYRVRRRGVWVPITSKDGQHLSPSSPGFLAAYERALRKLGAPTERRSIQGTVSDLVQQYRASQKYKALAPRTRKDYDRYLDMLDANIGVDMVDEFTVEDVTDIMETLTPHGANYMRAVLSVLFRFALQKPRRFGLTHNPAHLADKVSYEKEAYPAWPEALIAKMRESAPPDVLLAMEVALHTGQRGQDVVRMTWRDFDEKDRIHVVQEKTGKKVWLRCPPHLIAALRQAQRSGVTILTTKTGRSWTENWLRKQLSEWSKRLGYPGHSTHGLRKSSVNRLLLAGNNEKAVGLTVGMSEQMVRHYSKDIDAQKMADGAIARLADHLSFRD